MLVDVFGDAVVLEMVSSRVTSSLENEKKHGVRREVERLVLGDDDAGGLAPPCVSQLIDNGSVKTETFIVIPR